MAVFTKITEAEVSSVLQQYAIGDLVSLAPIGQGIENSNYFLSTELSEKGRQEWVLTIFETLSAEELPFFFGLTQALSEAGLPVPAPVCDRQKNARQIVAAKPLVIFPRFQGDWYRRPGDQARDQVAIFIADMHRVKLKLPKMRQQVRNMRWIREQVACLKDQMAEESYRLLLSVQAALLEKQTRLDRLPKTIVHGDLFRDNILFHQGKIAGVIDFYHACVDIRLFDLAVAVNDWCAENNGSLNWAHVDAMYTSYGNTVSYSAKEEQSWPYVLLLAALRFWLSRLTSRYIKGYQSDAIQGDISKDPEEFRRKILSINENFSLF